ncbi:hypothetical protein D3C81_2061610 [compost metagenome]
MQAVRTGMQHAAGIAQARDRSTIEQMRVYTCHLRGHVGAQAQGATGQLVDQFEGTQIHVMSGTGQQ